MRNRPLGSVCLVLAAVICVCVYVGKGEAAERLTISPVQERVADGSMICLEGQVYQKEIKEKYQVLYLKNNSIYYQKQSLLEPRIIIYDEGKKEIQIGNSVRAEGMLSFYEPPRNPGNFDQRLYYRRQSICGFVWPKIWK